MAQYHQIFTFKYTLFFQAYILCSVAGKIDEDLDVILRLLNFADQVEIQHAPLLDGKFRPHADFFIHASGCESLPKDSCNRLMPAGDSCSSSYLWMRESAKWFLQLEGWKSLHWETHFSINWRTLCSILTRGGARWKLSHHKTPFSKNWRAQCNTKVSWSVPGPAGASSSGLGSLKQAHGTPRTDRGLTAPT